MKETEGGGEQEPGSGREEVGGDGSCPVTQLKRD